MHTHTHECVTHNYHRILANQLQEINELSDYRITKMVITIRAADMRIAYWGSCFCAPQHWQSYSFQMITVLCHYKHPTKIVACRNCYNNNFLHFFLQCHDCLKCINSIGSRDEIAKCVDLSCHQMKTIDTQGSCPLQVTLICE